MPKKDIVEQFTSNVNVGMDEVVSVFLSQYESNAFARKNELQEAIKQLKAARKQTAKEVAGRVDISGYSLTNTVIGISASVTNVQIDWTGNKRTKPAVVVTVEVVDTDNPDSYHNLDKQFRTPLTKAELTAREKGELELTELNDQLSEVMTQIKTIGRKERQVRGRIAEMKLKESGFESLLENPEMLALVQLD